MIKTKIVHFSLGSTLNSPHLSLSRNIAPCLDFVLFFAYNISNPTTGSLWSYVPKIWTAIINNLSLVWLLTWARLLHACFHSYRAADLWDSFDTHTWETLLRKHVVFLTGHVRHREMWGGWGMRARKDSKGNRFSEAGLLCKAEIISLVQPVWEEPESLSRVKQLVFLNENMIDIHIFFHIYKLTDS